jgi:hypothetical protein
VTSSQLIYNVEAWIRLLLSHGMKVLEKYALFGQPIE